MKKTMTKEEFNNFWRKSKWGSDGLYDALSEAGISFDIYTDSEGQIINPGDECEFWDYKQINGVKSVFCGVNRKEEYLSESTYYTFCRKLPAEVWEPVPMEDISFKGGEFNPAMMYITDTSIIANPLKWEQIKIVDGKPVGVSK